MHLSSKAISIWYVVTKKSQKLSFKYLSIITFVLKIITLAENNAKSIASILRWRFGQELFSVEQTIFNSWIARMRKSQL